MKSRDYRFLLLIACFLSLTPCVLATPITPTTSIVLDQRLPDLTTGQNGLKPAIRLMAYSEYRPLIESAECDWQFIEYVAQQQDRDIELYYASVQDSVQLALSGQADGIYYVSKALSYQVPSLSTVEHSLLRDPMRAYVKSTAKVSTFGQLKGRKVTYLPGFLGFDRLVEGGYFHPKSIAAESLAEMVQLVGSGRVEAMFVIGRFEPLLQFFGLALEGTELVSFPTPQEAQLYIYLGPSSEHLMASLNQAFLQSKADKGLKTHNLDPFNCT